MPEIFTRAQFWERFDAAKDQLPEGFSDWRTFATALHREYYGQIVREIKCFYAVSDLIPRVKTSLENGDFYLNDIPLQIWDARALQIPGANAALKARGDWLSLGTGVCLLKEAARILATEGME